MSEYNDGFKVGDLVATHCDSFGMWLGGRWICMPTRWSDRSFKVVVIEAEGRRLMVEEYPVSTDGPVGVTAEWCKPWN